MVNAQGNDRRGPLNMEDTAHQPMASAALKTHGGVGFIDPHEKLPEGDKNLGGKKTSGDFALGFCAVLPQGGERLCVGHVGGEVHFAPFVSFDGDGVDLEAFGDAADDAQVP